MRVILRKEVPGTGKQNEVVDGLKVMHATIYYQRV